MVETAGKRALRTMDLIPYILENPGSSIKSLARNFATTESQIEKDLQLIFMCGLPGYTPYELIDIVFDNGVVTVVDPQVLDKPRRFSRSELVVVVIGLRILAELYSANSSHTAKIEKLIRKVSNLVPTFSTSDSSLVPKPEILVTINRAIGLNQELEIEYTSISKDEVKTRKIIPTEVYMLNGKIYVRAIDTELSAERIFRSDLIKILKEGNPRTIELVNRDSVVHKVSLSISKEKRVFLERNSFLVRGSQESETTIQVDLEVSNLHWLKRCILSNAPHIKVLAPAEFAVEINTAAQAILALYGSQ